MTRRKFISISILTFVGIFILFFALLPFEQVVWRILKNDLGSLDIDDDIFEKYLDEAKSRGYFSSFDIRKKWLIRFYDRLPLKWLPMPYTSKYNQYRSELVADFLLSTDYFINKMNKDRKISYLGIYDPYRRPCSNPFSNLYYRRQ